MNAHIIQFDNGEQMEVNVHELGQDEMDSDEIDLDAPIKHVQCLVNNTNILSNPHDKKPQCVFMDKETWPSLTDNDKSKWNSISKDGKRRRFSMGRSPVCGGDEESSFCL